jgi:hypothetical protein
MFNQLLDRNSINQSILASRRDEGGGVNDERAGQLHCVVLGGRTEAAAWRCPRRADRGCYVVSSPAGRRVWQHP